MKRLPIKASHNIHSLQPYSPTGFNSTSPLSSPEESKSPNPLPQSNSVSQDDFKHAWEEMKVIKQVVMMKTQHLRKKGVNPMKENQRSNNTSINGDSASSKGQSLIRPRRVDSNKAIINTQIQTDSSRSSPSASSLPINTKKQILNLTRFKGTPVSTPGSFTCSFFEPQLVGPVLDQTLKRQTPDTTVTIMPQETTLRRHQPIEIWLDDKIRESDKMRHRKKKTMHKTSAKELAHIYSQPVEGVPQTAPVYNQQVADMLAHRRTNTNPAKYLLIPVSAIQRGGSEKRRRGNSRNPGRQMIPPETYFQTVRNDYLMNGKKRKRYRKRRNPSVMPFLSIDVTNTAPLGSTGSLKMDAQSTKTRHGSTLGEEGLFGSIQKETKKNASMCGGEELKRVRDLENAAAKKIQRAFSRHKSDLENRLLLLHRKNKKPFFRDRKRKAPRTTDASPAPAEANRLLKPVPLIQSANASNQDIPPLNRTRKDSMTQKYLKAVNYMEQFLQKYEQKEKSMDKIEHHNMSFSLESKERDSSEKKDKKRSRNMTASATCNNSREHAANPAEKNKRESPPQILSSKRPATIKEELNEELTISPNKEEIAADEGKKAEADIASDALLSPGLLPKPSQNESNFKTPNFSPNKCEILPNLLFDPPQPISLTFSIGGTMVQCVLYIGKSGAEHTANILAYCQCSRDILLDICIEFGKFLKADASGGVSSLWGQVAGNWESYIKRLIMPKVPEKYCDGPQAEGPSYTLIYKTIEAILNKARLHHKGLLFLEKECEDLAAISYPGAFEVYRSLQTAESPVALPALISLFDTERMEWLLREELRDLQLRRKVTGKVIRFWKGGYQEIELEGRLLEFAIEREPIIPSVSDSKKQEEQAEIQEKKAEDLQMEDPIFQLAEELNRKTPESADMAKTAKQGVEFCNSLKATQPRWKKQREDDDDEDEEEDEDLIMETVAPRKEPETKKELLKEQPANLEKAADAQTQKMPSLLEDLRDLQINMLNNVVAEQGVITAGNQKYLLTMKLITRKPDIEQTLYLHNFNAFHTTLLVYSNKQFDEEALKKRIESQGKEAILKEVEDILEHKVKDLSAKQRHYLLQNLFSFSESCICLEFYPIKPCAQEKAKLAQMRSLYMSWREFLLMTPHKNSNQCLVKPSFLKLKGVLSNQQRSYFYKKLNKRLLVLNTSAQRYLFVDVASSSKPKSLAKIRELLCKTANAPEDVLTSMMGTFSKSEALPFFTLNSANSLKPAIKESTSLLASISNNNKSSRRVSTVVSSSVGSSTCLRLPLAQLVLAKYPYDSLRNRSKYYITTITSTKILGNKYSLRINVVYKDQNNQELIMRISPQSKSLGNQIIKVADCESQTFLMEMLSKYKVNQFNSASMILQQNFLNVSNVCGHKLKMKAGIRGGKKPENNLLQLLTEDKGCGTFSTYGDKQVFFLFKAKN